MNYSEEIQAKLERAEASLQAARLLLASELLDDSASRAYYTVFHAASALLLSRGLNFNSHSGVLRAISLNFAKTGEMEKGLGRDINWLAELRQVGDYGEVRKVSGEEAIQAITIASEFLDKVRSILRLE
ncbi:HEPN domain-containing protein [Trichothermofontia sp.]